MKNADRYVKVLSLVTLISVVYWRDLAALLLAAFSLRWIGFTLAIIPLAFLSLYQKRKVLDVFTAMPESKHPWEIVLFISAIILYIFGSYSEYALWFHVFSLIIFITAYLMLRIDFRVSKIAFLPTMELAVMSLWVIPSAALTETAAASVAAYLVSAVYVTFLALSIFRNIPRKVSASQLCPVCQSAWASKEAFCPHCGRQRSMLVKSSSEKHAIAGFLVLLTIVSIFAFLFVPVLVLADHEPNVTLYMARGAEIQPILETPNDWVLESSTRLSAYETEHSEDFAVLNLYAEQRYAENKSCILLEISGGPDWSITRMNSWQIQGWTRTVGPIAVLLDNVAAQYVVLKRQNNTIVAVYNTSPLKLSFKTSSSFEIKNVGLSVFMNLTNLKDSDINQVLTQLINIGEPIVRRFVYIELWTLHASTLTNLYIQFGGIFYTVIGVAGVFSFAGWARVKDDREARLIDETLSLPKSEALLFAVAVNAKGGQTGAELFDAYNNLSKIDVNKFYEKLDRLVTLGLMKKHYRLKNCEVLLTWKTAVP
jgi:hypothetical protein